MSPFKSLLASLPSEIWLDIFSFLPSHDSSNLLSVMPFLKDYNYTKSIIISFVNPHSEQIFTQDASFIDRRQTNNVHTVEIPFKDVKELRQEATKSKIKETTNTILSQIRQYIQETPSIQEVILEFAHDLESDSLYDLMEIYPTVIYPHFRKIPHTVEILKLERSLLNFTKSCHHRLTLFDCFAPLYEVDNYNFLERTNADLKIKLHTGIFQRDNSIEDDMTRAISLFGEQDQDLRDEILNLKESNLKEVNLIVPFEQNKDGFYWHENDPEMFKLKDISALQASIRYQHEYYAYFKKILAPAQLPLIQQCIIEDKLNKEDYQFKTSVVDERPEENRWMNLNKSYELLYHLFNCDHWFQQDLTDNNSREKALETIKEFFVKSVSRKYQYYVNINQDVSDPRFLNLNILQHTLRGSEDLDEITNVVKNIKGSHSLPVLRAFSELLP
ncbi:hypothetical protein WICPIJ_001224 [Wickerhamomyces pijperi]|uniref:F-box domain-containing protein n=1 Tax=Wickerhamomyces pijperi TaxID=599730 RepID=A0A9P8TRG2_WICPI|nr:hypothetical protein WICPIJ_001224 [Wickerhamomyces pijperi]